MAQLSASIVSAGVVFITFENPTKEMFRAIAFAVPRDTDIARLFATEFFCTFILSYTCFTVAFEEAEKQKKEATSFKTISDSEGLTLYATTPNSKTGKRKVLCCSFVECDNI